MRNQTALRIARANIACAIRMMNHFINRRQTEMVKYWFSILTHHVKTLRAIDATHIYACECSWTGGITQVFMDNDGDRYIELCPNCLSLPYNLANDELTWTANWIEQLGIKVQ